ncbi:MAG: hypothetical protein K0R87_981 [Pseudonocardia sp.]|nr:hypothetical protein [Pseudonocardia sp.]
MHTHPDLASPWVFSTRELGRRAGAMRAYHREVPAPPEERRIGLDVIAVPAGAPVVLDVRLEAVTEGVYVSGTVSVPLDGECARCLDEVTDELTVELGELFAYPDSVTDETTDDDELPRVVDCAGLCPDCGQRRADLEPGHRHEILDPRWAALHERSSANQSPNHR